MSEPANKSSVAGRVVDNAPVLSVLLEPRSVIITTSSLYTSHLHGIQETAEDILVSSTVSQVPLVAGLGVPIANWDLIATDSYRKIGAEDIVLRRGIRYSLTCRDVERVAGGKTFLRR